MQKFMLMLLVAVLVMASMASAATVWDPAANGIYPPATGNWNDATNWTAGVPVLEFLSPLLLVKSKRSFIKPTPQSVS